MEETLQTIGEKLVKLDESLEAFGKKFDAKLDAIDKKFDEKLDAGFTAIAEHFGKIDERFVRVDERFTKIDERFTKIDERFTKIDERFTTIDDRFTKIDDRFTKIDEHLTRIDGRLLQFDGRFKQSDDRFGRIEKRFDGLEARVLTGFDEVKGGLKLVAERVDDFLKKDTANIAAHTRFEQALEDHDNRLLALETGHARRPEAPEPPPRSGPALTNSEHDLE